MNKQQDTIFIDDSGFGASTYILTGIYIPQEQLQLAEDRMKKWRDSLFARYGIPASYELHATKFVNARGRPAGPDRPIYTPTRIKIFRECLQTVAEIPDVRIFNTLSSRKETMRVFERLLNRLYAAANHRNKIVKILCDPGKEAEMDRLLAQRRIYNQIPSRYGTWSTGGQFKNIPLDRIDPEIGYPDSRENHFIQAADFCAYAVLRWKAEEMPNRTRHGLHEAYRILEQVFERRAFRKDPHGIIRP